MATSTFTTDFREEYHQAQEVWLRRRFLWYAGVVLGLGVLSFVAALAFMMFLPDSDDRAQIASSAGLLQILVGLVPTVVYAAAFVYVQKHLLDRTRLLRLVFALIVGTGLLSLVSTPIIFELTRDQLRARIAEAEERGEAVVQQVSPGVTFSFSPGEDDEPAAVPSDGAPVEEPEASSADEAAAPAAGRRTVSERELNKQIARMVVAGNGLGNIFLTHLFACLFLPWTARESLRPMLPLIIANTLITLMYIRLVPVGGTISILASPLTALPGAAICWWRQSRFRDKFHFQMLKGRYGEIKQELGYARKIHESLFPAPVSTGSVRMDYRYEPMRQIGGDYLYARVAPVAGRGEPIMHLALIDVTGHGIGAALTVNRLHGELDRQFGERPDASPGDVLTGLNSYLHHSLSLHSVYATALLVRVDPNAGTLTWASAGHPPAFVRTVDGKIEQLDSTTLVLGACKGDDFEHGEMSIRFLPGDAMISYTDGAIECRDADGKMMGVAGMRRVVASAVPDAEGGWASSVLRAVDQFRAGPLADDTLVVEVWRPLRF